MCINLFMSHSCRPSAPYSTTRSIRSFWQQHKKRFFFSYLWNDEKNSLDVCMYMYAIIHYAFLRFPRSRVEWTFWNPLKPFYGIEINKLWNTSALYSHFFLWVKFSWETFFFDVIQKVGACEGEFSQNNKIKFLSLETYENIMFFYFIS